MKITIYGFVITRLIGSSREPPAVLSRRPLVPRRVLGVGGGADRDGRPVKPQDRPP